MIHKKYSGCLTVTNANVQYRIFQGICRMALVNIVKFVVLKRSYSLRVKVFVFK